MLLNPREVWDLRFVYSHFIKLLFSSFNCHSLQSPFSHVSVVNSLCYEFSDVMSRLYMQLQTGKCTIQFCPVGESSVTVQTAETTGTLIHENCVNDTRLCS